jgi:hypothetical protein
MKPDSAHQSVQHLVNSSILAVLKSDGATAKLSLESRDDLEQRVTDHYWGDRLPMAPAVLSSESYAAIARASCDVLNALAMLLARPTAAELIRQLSGLSNAEASAAATWNCPDPFLLARSDVIASGGKIAVTEVNVTSRLGMLFEHDLMAATMERQDACARTVQAQGLRRGGIAAPFGKLMRAAAGADDATFCIAYGQEFAKRKSRYTPELIQRMLGELGFRSVTSELAELRADDHGLVHPRAGRIDILYRLFSPEDLIETPLIGDLTSACASSSRLVVIDGLMGETYATKIALTLLSDPSWRRFLPGDLADRIQDCVPWTRIVADASAERNGSQLQLVSFILQHRQRLVLKPGRGSGGVWVVIGARVTQPQWESAVRAALRSQMPWVIQDFVESDTETLLTVGPDGAVSATPRQVNYGALLIDRNCAGIIRRDDSANAAVINVGQGSKVAPLYYPTAIEG